QTRSRRTPLAPPGERQAIGGDHPRSSRSSPQRFLACQCVGEGGELHFFAMAKAHPLPGTLGAGIEHQPGGELDPSGRVGPEELDSCRQPAGRAEGGGNSPPSWKPAAASRFRSVATWPLFCRVLPTSPSSASLTLPPRRGLPDNSTSLFALCRHLPPSCRLPWLPVTNSGSPFTPLLQHQIHARNRGFPLTPTIEPTPNQKALCPGCRASVISKCGEVYAHHWANQS